ncbi:exopolysaccharide biosynthesis protein [Mesorhizobium sp. J428]|uniref:exopolysaccharide biosynthesis protein n=1 Tax=Mesorhizobium sp. J428 TaxID=2898440 RepID=UPI0021515847|nr:exopolysaccharide biosynthesis protein [Mesorhizobium sp. J428]MCR5859103.1 exopolysaccharide biosynthesis protein [Mesorhizobium sp. J428]
MSIEFADTRESLYQALTRAIDSIEGSTITLRKLLALVGEHGLLFLCALLTIPFLIPVSIPGVSTVFGAAIILVSIGITTNRMPWLPDRIMDKEMDAVKLSGILRRGAEVVAKVETYIRPRAQGITGSGIASRINGLALIFAGVLLMAPLGLVPFSNTLPAFAILLLAVGMSQRDGLVVLAGYAMIVATLIYFGVLAWLAFAAGQGLAGFFGG